MVIFLIMRRARINTSAAIIIHYVVEKWCDVMPVIFDEFRKKQWKLCARKVSSRAEHVAAAAANFRRILRPNLVKNTSATRSSLEWRLYT